MNIKTFKVCLDERKIRGKEIEKELFFLVCLYEKMKGKKKIIMSNNKFILIFL